MKRRGRSVTGRVRSKEPRVPHLFFVVQALDVVVARVLAPLGRAG